MKRTIIELIPLDDLKKVLSIVEVSVNNQFYKGILSFGNNRIVNGDKLDTEVCIVNFDQDIYDKNDYSKIP